MGTSLGWRCCKCVKRPSILVTGGVGKRKEVLGLLLYTYRQMVNKLTQLREEGNGQVIGHLKHEQSRPTPFERTQETGRHCRRCNATPTSDNSRTHPYCRTIPCQLITVRVAKTRIETSFLSGRKGAPRIDLRGEWSQSNRLMCATHYSEASLVGLGVTITPTLSMMSNMTGKSTAIAQ